MPERPKGVDSKSTVSLWHRGFESLSLRHFMKKFINQSFCTLTNLFANDYRRGTFARLIQANYIASGYQIFHSGQRMGIERRIPRMELSLLP